MESDHLWYLAYGSNLSEGRFQEYLDRCSEPVTAGERRPTTLPHRLFFAQHSDRWRGGPAFVDPVVDPGAETRATAWLLGREQFLDVLAMENAQSPGTYANASLPSAPGSSLPVATGRYAVVVAVPSPDDRPAFTFTTGARPLPAPTRAGADYIDVIVSGLVADHGLTEREARAYLAERGA